MAVSQDFVTLGMHKIVLDASAGDSADEFYQLEHIPIERSKVHPKYNPLTGEYDFWLIKLKWPSQLYADQVIDLDTPMDDFELTKDDMLVSMGFGLSMQSPQKISPTVLQEVTLKYITNGDCIAPKTKYPASRITNSMLCAGSNVGKGACRVIISIIMPFRPCCGLFST
jgi:hypothetical protein